MVEIFVSGDYACFTRPEAKVERVSYPVMTPTAARGVLESIYWKPGLRYRVNRITVLRPIQFTTITRSEQKTRASVRTIQTRLARGQGHDAHANQTLRQSVMLRDVAYVISATLFAVGTEATSPASHTAALMDRVTGGQCYMRPYLGCRECAVTLFRAALPLDVPDPTLNRDLGRMLWDLDYAGDGSGRATPAFFDARLTGGVLVIPDRTALDA